ncbi:integrase [Streptomyces phaeochromogenes]|uniref:site-specific integrase n=1 Tax=Streptomyces phaeochromogenes TaxID=1923 RepID=UPI0027911802|nr:site-specific integrase [Streptomyces phaeochromogenes]MDQ0951539.1 integrase [Streptomyces phaeochromogenes]
MEYVFVSHAKVRRHAVALEGVDLDWVEYVTRPGALKEGTPFFMGSDMRPLEPLTSCFFELAKRLGAGSLEDYAYDLMDASDFLEILDPPADLLSATEEDLLAYRDWLTEQQDEPVMDSTWMRRRAAINNFYDWAVDPDVKVLDRRPYHRRKNGKDVLSLPVVNDLDVRHLTYSQWRFLKQVGLRGLLPDERVDRSFRGGAPLRNCAVAELAVTTGMRLREFSTLLDVEVGPPRRDGSATLVDLKGTAKYKLPRTVEIQHATVREIDFYRRTERAKTVHSAARTLQRRRAELFVVDDINSRQGKLSGILHGRRRTFVIKKMDAATRRITVIEGDRGLESMALFVGRGGLMLSPQRWEQIFASAHTRALRISEEYKVKEIVPSVFKIHDLRHTFAVSMLQLLTELVAEQEAELRRLGGHGAYLADHISKSPQLTVQRLLGHRRPSSTMRYLRYIRKTNLLVARAIAEWNSQDTTYADYAARLAPERAA